MDLLTVRSYRPEDRNFILSTWLRGLYHGNDFFGLIPQDIYFKRYHAALEVILSSPNTSIRIACLSDDSDVILGYAVLSLDAKTLHWAFVKSAFRRNGIARRLIPTDIQAVTHLTKVGASILKTRPGVVFNPFAVNP